MRIRFRHASTFLLLALVVQLARGDLYLFTKDKDIFEATANSLKGQDLASSDQLYAKSKEDDRLYLFPNVRQLLLNAYNYIQFALCGSLKANFVALKSRECLEQFDLESYLKAYGNVKLCNSYCATQSEENAKEGNAAVLTRSAILQFYRNFIHSFLGHLNYDVTTFCF